MWTYEQRSGRIMDASGRVCGSAYSGHGQGLNDPDYQNVPEVGPVPQGVYTILPPIDTVEHGPFVLALEPQEGTETFGRSGFLIHGDSKAFAGQFQASHGCIVTERVTRELLWNSGDHVIEVIAGDYPL
jgi:hypothetical protein